MPEANTPRGHYAPVLEQEPREVSRPGQWRRAAKVAAVLGLTGVGVVAVLSGGSGAVAMWAGIPARASEDGIVGEFHIKSFPSDCPKFMRYIGCKKKAWGCEEDDGTLGWKCCCNNDLWPIPPKPDGLSMGSGSLSKGGDLILRLQKTADVCLGGPGDSLTFAFAPCGESNTRFKLPQRGAGPIELTSQPGQCLGVQGGMKQLVLLQCNQGSPEQNFQLTNGDSGMLQWTNGGNLCLDSENGATEAGSKLVLADCVYWPKKPSQFFVLEDAPPPKPEKEGEKDKKVVQHPTLFCHSLMLFWTYEVDMLRSHIASPDKVGIFGCDEWAVYSNKTVWLNKTTGGKGDDVFSDVMEGSLAAKVGGKYHTALNTPIFRRYWDRIIKDPKSWRNDWNVKVDPDAVFFADRLKDLLKSWKPGGVVDYAVWLNNCQLGLHGPIEVFNRHALGVYNKNKKKCDKVAEKHGQEDVFLRACFKELKIGMVDAFNLLFESEWACNERPSSREMRPPCYDRQVSFHPFKTVKSYWNCYSQASRMWWREPMFVISEPPSKSNHHHA